MPSNRTNSGMNIPFVSGSSGANESVGVGMFKDSLLMGTFTLPPPLTPKDMAPICMIPSCTFESHGFTDPCVVPNPSKLESFRASMLLSAVEIAFQKSSRHLLTLTKISNRMCNSINTHCPCGLSLLAVCMTS